MYKSQVEMYMHIYTLPSRRIFMNICTSKTTDFEWTTCPYAQKQDRPTRQVTSRLATYTDLHSNNEHSVMHVSLEDAPKAK